MGRLVAGCEFSDVVAGEFRKLGHDAWSCDLLPTEGDSRFHIQGNIFDHLDDGWDAMIFFYPCTNMAVSGARWFKDKRQEQERDVQNFIRLAEYSGIGRIGGENPIGVLSTKYRKPDQIIQPHQFGHPEYKATCLWLKNLPPLRETNKLPEPVRGSEEWKKWMRVHREPPGPDRWKNRSRTYRGIAEAMAQQWGALI